MTAVNAAVGSTSLLLKSNQTPLIVTLDFDRVNMGLLKHLRKNPQDLHKLNWASFEGLTELLLRELGYDVFRTKLSQEGGVDIWALQRNDFGDILYAIDAIKYSPKQLVGPQPVDSIYSVADMNNASVGMIITTSGFTKAARDIESQFRNRIALKDYYDLVKWLNKVSG